MLAAVRFLRWSDVDPGTHALDVARARAVAETCVAGGGEANRLAESLARALVAEHGAWVMGWAWPVSEGGPVRAWCCAKHSLSGDAATSVERVVAAVVEWRGFLVELGDRFAELQRDGASLSIEEGVERAAARLLPVIVERTGHEDAWYATFERVVSWYLDTSGHDPSHALVHGVVSGRFASWVAPSPSDAQAVCADLGLEAAVAATRVPSDALAAWRVARGHAFRNAPASRPRDPVVRDGHERYVRDVDRVRDPVRADRMTVALAACRASARGGEPLTLDRMRAWQSLVLGAPAELRSAEAFAKGGRERYPHDAELHGRFARAIEEANGDRETVGVRAVRAYLDTCFFHPFIDGNARAARLALDFVLTREGLALHAVEPLFVARAAADADGAWSMALVLEMLVGPIAR